MHALTSANRMIQNAISWPRDINSKLLVCREGDLRGPFFLCLVLSPRLGERRNNAGRYNARISLRTELFVIRKPFRSTRTHSTLMDTDYISRTVDAASARSAFHPAKYVLRALKSKATGLVDFSLWPASSLAKRSNISFLFSFFSFFLFSSFLFFLFSSFWLTFITKEARPGTKKSNNFRWRESIRESNFLEFPRLAENFSSTWDTVKMVGEGEGGREKRSIDRWRNNGFDRCYAAHGNS